MTTTQPVTQEEDPLAEAMSMLDSLGGGEIGNDDDDDDDDFEDFAIDSDDDDDDEVVDLNLDDLGIDLNDVNSGAASNGDAGGAEKKKLLLGSEIGGLRDNLQGKLSVDPAASAAGGANAVAVDTATAGGAVDAGSPPRATAKSTAATGHGHGQQSVAHPLAHPLQDILSNSNTNSTNISSPPSTSTSTSVPTSSSVSGWTSSFASFASRAAASVQSAVENAETAVLTGHTSTNAHAPPGGIRIAQNSHLQQQQQQQQAAMQQGAATGAPASGVMSYQERQKLLHQQYHANNNANANTNTTNNRNNNVNTGGLKQPPPRQSQSTNANTAILPVSSAAGGFPVPTSTIPTPSAPSSPPNNTTVRAQTTMASEPTFLDKLTSNLDASVKTKLMASALGKLLPGEKVIMFLNSLNDVRDCQFGHTFVGSEDILAERGLGEVLGCTDNSNHNHINNNHGGDDTSVGEGAVDGGVTVTTVWCCVMTFYRVAVFSYQATSDGKVLLDEGEGEGNASNNNNSNNEGVVSQWLSSQNVSVQFQAAHCPPNAQSDNTKKQRHNVFQMPLASIERVEKVMASSQRNSAGGPPGSSIIASGYSNGGGYSAYNAMLPSSSAVSSTAVSSAMVSLGSQMKPLLGGMTSSSSNSNLITNGLTSSSSMSASGGGGGSSNPNLAGGASSATNNNAPTGPLGMILHSKIGSWIKFSTSSITDAQRAHDALNTYAFPGRRNLGYLFAFESRRSEVMAGGGANSQGQGQPGQPQLGQQSGGADGSRGGGNPVGTAAAPTERRFKPLEEFERQGLFTSQDGRVSPWAPILNANANYGLCSTYPSVLVGPRSIVGDGDSANSTHSGAGSSIHGQTTTTGDNNNIALLRRVAAFRCGNRFPALTWGNPRNGGSIWRSSQPKVGLQGNRSADDERYLYAVAEEAKRANLAADAREEGGAGRGAGADGGAAPSEFLRMLCGRNNEGDLIVEGGNSSCMLKIMDMRPKSAAMGNRTQGYGYENTNNYRGSTINFYGIGNIHAVRDAYQKMSTLCLSPNTSDFQWMQLLENTNWPSLIRLVLSAAWQTAFHVHYNRFPVLVHCSHGWDRTSQVPALAQLFLDPHFRTREGFSTLVEKDFLSFGHPFHTRCGHGEGKNEQGGGDEGNLTPIFLQFLDCVWQLVNQFPDYFEFNARYLLLLSEHIYSCRFGTLLCDSEREREVVAGIRQRTYCMWEYLDSIPELVNPMFNRDASEKSGVLLMPLPMLLRNVTLWTDRYCMYGAKATMPCIPPSLRYSYPPAYMAQYAMEQPLVLHTAKNGVEGMLARALEDAEMWKKQALDALKEVKELKEGQSETKTEDQGVQ